MKSWFLGIILLWAILPCFSQNKKIPLSQKLMMAEYFIHELYVDSLDEGQLIEAGIKGMLNTLDPHSTYLSAEEAKRFNELIGGSFKGIGISSIIVKDTLFVLEVLPKGPSDKVGLQVGDRIISIDGKAVAGVNKSMLSLQQKLRGEDNQVTLRIVRRQEPKPLDVNVTRKKIHVDAIESSYEIAPKVGYIRLNQFSKGVSKDLYNVLLKFKKSRITGLILDLRGNSGGLLEEAIEVANHFLNAEQRIVYTLGRADRNKSFYARGDGLFRSGKIVILQDELSASASEIVAGAIQDWDRGLIIGRRSFGKGLVQNRTKLFDGSEIRLTVARYYTPSGRCIQRPYLHDERGREEYAEDLANRLNRGELVYQDSIEYNDSLKYNTLLKFRPIYAGGGISPDIFVPSQSSIFSKCTTSTMGITDSIQQMAIIYAEHYQNQIKEYSSIEEYISHSNFDEALDSQLEQLIEASLPINERQQCHILLKQHIKLIITQYIWGKERYLKDKNKLDPIVIEALQCIEGDDYSNVLGY